MDPRWPNQSELIRWHGHFQCGIGHEIHESSLLNWESVTLSKGINISTHLNQSRYMDTCKVWCLAWESWTRSSWLGNQWAKGMRLPIGRQEWDRKSTCGPTHNVKKTWNSREKTWTTVSDRERPFICVKGIGPKMAWITVNNCLFWNGLLQPLRHIKTICFSCDRWMQNNNS
jgi:hypothetical protein